jgi:single-strand DNA-binding protein
MSSSFNKITLIGRVGSKPVVSTRNSDQKMAKFSLATSETWKDKESFEKKEKTEWHRIVVYNSKLAEVIDQYVDAGTLVFIEGKVQYSKWVDPNGVERNLTDVVVDLGGQFRILEKKGVNKSEESRHESSSNIEDEIPF